MALQPSLQVPEVPGTFTLSIAICQYPRLVTGALNGSATYTIHATACILADQKYAP